MVAVAVAARQSGAGLQPAGERELVAAVAVPPAA